MKKILMHCAVVLASSLVANSGIAAEVALGKPLPAIEAQLLDSSQKIIFGGASGKVLIVNFWASWCLPCRLEMPAIQAYYDKHKAQGVEVLAINMDEAKDIADVRKIAQGLNFPIALKANVDIKMFGRIWRMPSTFVVDRHGILRKNGHEGTPSVDLATLETVVTPLLTKP